MGILLSPFEWIVDFTVEAGIYLESGFIDLLSTGQCTEDAYKPGILHFDSATATYTSSTTTPLQGAVTHNVQFDETITVVHDTEVGTTSQINTAEYINVTNITDTVEYTSGTDYTITINGLTALSSGSIADSQDVLIDYTKVVAALPDQSPFNGEVLTTNTESRAVGCDTKLATITDPCSNTYIAGGYCDASLQLNKDAQEKVPSSMFSGKLKLLVQAIYGSIRTDYKRQGYNLIIGEAGNVDNPEFTFNRGFTDNSWLYTTDNYDYYIFTHKGATLEVRPVILSVSALQMRDILVNHALNTDHIFTKRVEAYILSTAKISETAVSVSITGDAIIGNPLDYGWHTSWKGDAATVVCYREDPVNAQYLSDHYRLIITESFDGTNYTFTAVNTAATKDAEWWPQTNSLQVFYFEELVGSMFPVPYPAPVFGGFEGTFDAPIYVHYEINESTGAETEVITNIFMNIYTPANINYNSPTEITAFGPYTFLQQKEYAINSKAGNKGFRIDGAEVSVEVESVLIDYLDTMSPDAAPRYYGWPISQNGPFNSHLYSDWIAYGADNGLTAGQKKEFIHEGNTVDADWGWWAEFAQFNLVQERKESGSKSGAVFFEVLLGNNTAVVAGKEFNEVTGAGGKTIATVGHPYRVAYGGDLVWFLDNSVQGKPILETIVGPPSDTYMIAGPQNGSATFTNTPIAASNVTTTTLYYKPPGAALATASVTSAAGNQEYFSPTISNPQTNTVDESRSSVTNLYKIDHAEFTQDGGFLYDSSVGWS